VYVTGNEPPEDPSEAPTGYYEYDGHAQGDPERGTPWYRRPIITLAIGLFAAILLGLVIYLLADQTHGTGVTKQTPTSPTTSTTTPTTTEAPTTTEPVAPPETTTMTETPTTEPTTTAPTTTTPTTSVDDGHHHHHHHDGGTP
jgi:cytoskeletal protein RodZ